MKMFISVLSAAAMLTAPLTAYADTDLSAPGSAETNVKFSTSAGYVVTIPATVSLSEVTKDGADKGKYTNKGTITAKNVLLEENEKLVVTVSSDSGFKMTTGASATYKLPYTASTAAFGAVDASNDKVAEFASSKDVQKADVTFTTEVPEYAGSYSDTVVFTIAVQ